MSAESILAFAACFALFYALFYTAERFRPKRKPHQYTWQPGKGSRDTWYYVDTENGFIAATVRVHEDGTCFVSVDVSRARAVGNDGGSRRYASYEQAVEGVQGELS